MAGIMDLFAGGAMGDMIREPVERVVQVMQEMASQQALILERLDNIGAALNRIDPGCIERVEGPSYLQIHSEDV